jgi:hypothetical protein
MADDQTAHSWGYDYLAFRHTMSQLTAEAFGQLGML